MRIGDGSAAKWVYFQCGGPSPYRHRPRGTRAGGGSIMSPRLFWWIMAVLLGALIAGGFLAVQYAKQQVPNEFIEDSGLR